MNEEATIINCPDCETKVTAKVLATKRYQEDEETPLTSEILFLECPVCHRTMVGGSDLIQVGEDEWEFERPTRLWPEPKDKLDPSIPPLVQNSIHEARACYRAKAFSACAVMCGRALEAICKGHKTANWQLAKGLKELKHKAVIDGRLYEWGEALRQRRNIGAHATEEEITREDASDLLDFTTAICDYVYVLSEKYQAFKIRESKPKRPKRSLSSSSLSSSTSSGT